MKVFRKLVMIVAVVLIGHSFAGKAFASDWQPPEAANSLEEPPVVMSAEELAVIEGGRYFAALTRNQMLITITGATVGFAAANIYIAINPLDSNRGWQYFDQLICNGLPGLSITVLGQMQISAGRVDNNRPLGAADVGVALAHVSAATGWIYGCPVINENFIKGADAYATKIVNKRDEKLASAPGAGARKLLRDTWVDNDRKFDYGLDQAQQARDKIELRTREIDGKRELRKLCLGTGLMFFPCLLRITVEISVAERSIVLQKKNLEYWTAFMAMILKTHAEGLGIPVPPTSKKGGGVYVIR